jgi:hypothetical protein
MKSCLTDYEVLIAFDGDGREATCHNGLKYTAHHAK